MDLQKIMNEKFDKHVESGAVDEMITKAVEKLLGELVSDYFRSYGTFGKELKEHLEKSININLSKLDLTTYNGIVTDIIKKHLEGTIAEHVTPVISESIDSILGVLQKKDWTLSEIVQQFLEQEVGSDSEEKEITFVVRKSSYGTRYVSLDEDKDKNHWNCKYMFSIDKDGTLFSYEKEGRKADPTRNSLHGRFEKLIFQIYSAKATITVDEDECRDKVESFQYEDTNW